MEHNVYVYILIMFAVTYTIRVLPLTLIRKPITNRFVRSFLFYVPYVTLAVMTFPETSIPPAASGRAFWRWLRARRSRFPAGACLPWPCCPARRYLSASCSCCNQSKIHQKTHQNRCVFLSL